MKNAIRMAVVSMVLAAGSQWVGAKEMSPASMDPLSVAPDMYSLVFANDRIRVMQVVFKPGQEIKKHSHPDHFVYVLEGGQLTLYKADGSSSVAEVKQGQVLWIAAETHWAKNTGTTQVKLLVTELKPVTK